MPRNNKTRPDYRKLYPDTPISDEVLAVLKESDRKMEYAEYDLKRENWSIDTDRCYARSLGSQEDSLDRLREDSRQFAADDEDICERITQAIMLDELRSCIKQLDDDERHLIHLLFEKSFSQRKTAETLGITQSKVNRQLKMLLKKLEKRLSQ